MALTQLCKGDQIYSRFIFIFSTQLIYSYIFLNCLTYLQSINQNSDIFCEIQFSHKPLKTSTNTDN